MSNNDSKAVDAEYPTSVEGKACRGLTCIRECIHCPATRKVATTDETDPIVQNFLKTLAEIAMAIAARKQSTSLSQREDR